ncbi:K02A2.6-like [Cordylochernes scorpioides]|uniref:K02A2.6-like n=1 Tax=Cordylochernes scorpioides TaxID=51811 RepID=A0ABY6KGQ2_9ARAC|nr:K02A2.6-like [Cordylochernes scorpioides]
MEAPLKDCTTLEQRAVIRFLNAEGIQTSQICQRMKNIYGFEVLEHPAYSPDLAPSDYFLFGLLKKELKGKRFDSDEDVQKVVQYVFHTLPKSAYKEGIYKLPERWRRCIESQDYYSRFPELALLEDQTTHSTIKHCKSIFARHGIPEEVRSDNGPQFGLEFKKFAKEYGFHHITSSLRFPQSNGFIESMVKNIKIQLKKERDPYLSLLGYRTAPLENGKKRKKNQRHKKKTHFDIHHRARELPHLDEGTRVWVKDLRVPGVVLEDAGSPRSYMVNSPKGILRRNRFHLLPNPQGEKIDMEDEEMESPEMSQCFTSTGDNTTGDCEPRTFQRSPEPVKTRSGRVIKPPDKLNF